MNKYFKAARTRLHKYLVGELNCTLIKKGERSWYYKSSSLDLNIRISDHLSTRDEDIFDIVFIKQSASNILIHFRNSVSLVNSFAELKATIRAADSMAIGLRPMNSCKTELTILSQKVADLSEKINSSTPDGFLDLSKLTKAQRNQVEVYLKQNTKD
ncbi:MAG: hypothetical protein PUJ51_14625 [Clostridiales bacterium]|uniref:hypothetical protein n=1 Tax=Terrisporobacter sp. TaxID=1965305 RepID=UPI002A543871|nr:hypothetical protein [Terrisporobacter sp.]MDD7755720.1 hypothetical protein [Clostridiales bacterium]MDY4137173.1 hypothetical protein [Terrisporobacter sp.]